MEEDRDQPTERGQETPELQLIETKLQFTSQEDGTWGVFFVGLFLNTQICSKYQVFILKEMVTRLSFRLRAEY